MIGRTSTEGRETLRRAQYWFAEAKCRRISAYRGKSPQHMLDLSFRSQWKQKSTALVFKPNWCARMLTQPPLHQGTLYARNRATNIYVVKCKGL